MASLIQQGVCPGIDLVVMLAGGGTGSDECKQKKLGAIDCRAASPSNKAAVVSQPYIDALHAMGVQTVITEPVPSKTAVIPGGMCCGLSAVLGAGCTASLRPASPLPATGRHTFWGLAISKLRLFSLPYDKLLWLDSDVFALHNLDHLLFYPEFTAAFTNDCCNKVSPLRISGGFWVVEPSPERYQHVATLFDGPDPLVEKNLEQANNHWHFGDMAVMLALFARVRKVPPYYIWPESYDLRQSKAWISQLYTGKRAQQLWNGTEGVMLASPADITTIPLDESIDPAFHYVVAKDDANMADPIAADIGHPELQGRVWHMLNESYDWLPVECTCIPNREQAPDKLYSLHFSCMPDSTGKPGDAANFEAQQAALDGEKFPPCLRKYFQKWVDAYKFGMGEYFGSIWRS